MSQTKTDITDKEVTRTDSVALTAGRVLLGLWFLLGGIVVTGLLVFLERFYRGSGAGNTSAAGHGIQYLLFVSAQGGYFLLGAVAAWGAWSTDTINRLAKVAFGALLAAVLVGASASGNFVGDAFSLAERAVGFLFPWHLGWLVLCRHWFAPLAKPRS